MAGPTLRQRMEEKLSAERAQVEEDFYLHIRDRVVAVVSERWMGNTLIIAIGRRDIDHPTYSRQNASKTYVQLAKEACVRLGAEPDLKGYKFEVRGDGIGRDDCSGHDVQLAIMPVEE